MRGLDVLIRSITPAVEFQSETHRGPCSVDLQCHARNDDLDDLMVHLRIDTPAEAKHYRHESVLSSCRVNSRRRNLTMTRATTSSTG